MTEQEKQAGFTMNKWVASHPWETLMLVLLAAALGIFLSNVTDYGISYDEPGLYEYADRMLDAYAKMAAGDAIDPLLDFYDLRYYGPAYLTPGNLARGGLTAIFPGLKIYIAWHIINFCVFLIGAWLVFILSSRLVAKPAAVFAAGLFFTQPLLWGHGVMNLKDVPFMTAFLAAVAGGLKMADVAAAKRESPSADLQNPFAWIIKLTPWKITGILLFLIVFFDRLYQNFISRPVVQTLLTALFKSASGSFFHAIRLRLVDPAGQIPFEDYLTKAMRQVNLTEFFILLAVLAALLIYLFRHASAVRRWVFLAGVLAGIALGIRVIGPAASALVLIYLMLAIPTSWGPTFFVYVLVSLITAYAVWPFLWGQPVSGLVESFQVMANFPWNGQVRFEGMDFPADALPWYYLPKLIGIQFTLPLVILSLIGSVLLLRRIIRKTDGWQFSLILIAWFWLALIGVIILRPNMYDNFRQFLFITPPLFVMAGSAWEALTARLKIPPLRYALALALLAPGIMSGIWLHPYEYVYYNALVGGTGGIERRYESDYWGTSMCEVGKILSQETQDVALVAMTNPVLSQFFQLCAEHPFDVRLDRSVEPTLRPEYVVLGTRFDDDLDYFRDYPVKYTVQRGSTIFAVVKVPPP